MDASNLRQNSFERLKKCIVRVGDLVKYKESTNNLTGIVKIQEGKKWFKVLWADNIILSEHLNDLLVISARAPNKKKRESK